MAAVFPARPESQLLLEECDLFPDSPTPVQQRFNPPPSPPPRIRSHYRPFSTLYTESPYIEFDKKAARLRYSPSSGGLQALNAMGINLKPKAKKASPPPRDLSISQVSAPLKVKGKNPGLEIERPSTSSGVMLTPPTAVQMKKKRSMASLFTTTPVDATPIASGSLARTEPRRRSPLGARHVISPSPPTPPERTSKSQTFAINRVPSEDNTEEAFEEFPSSHVFLPKHIWAKRRNTKLHPYHQEIPYMQSYDPILLESDRYTDILLQRLSNGQPSFHDYAKRPPSMVLDLGCGEGHWALNATSIWKNTEVTGLDIVDITLPAFQNTENLHFIQADFLERRLPFPSKRFDFVRMANLALCIPKDKWEHLFQEVYRVLAPGGRLEVIDDQIQFPYSTKPAHNLVAKFDSASSLDMFDSDDEKDEYDGETLLGHESTGTESTLVSDESRPSSFDGKRPQMSSSATVRQVDISGKSMSEYLPAASQYSTPVKSGAVRSQKYAREPRTYESESRHLAVAQQLHASRELEKIFRLMLRRQYSISYRPADRIVKYLHNVFGEESSGKKFSFHLKLAPGDTTDGVAAAEVEVERDDKSSIISVGTVGSQIALDTPTEKKKNWIGGDREKQKAKKADKERKKAEMASGADTDIISRSSSERSSVDSPVPPSATPYPASMNAKAAARLGLPIPGGPTGPSQNDPTTPTQPKTPSRRYSILHSTPAVSSPAPAPPTPVPPMINYNNKTANRLGVNADGTPVRIEKRRRRPKRKSTLVQSPGLVVFPATYLPLNPVELEMHASKNIHSLLGCRAALADFFALHTDEEGRRLVEDNEFDEIMWDYECFRRRRLNWPSEIVDLVDDDDSTNLSMFSSDSIPPMHSSKSVSPSTTPARDSADTTGSQYRRDDMTHVRTIRVFHAVKAGPPPLLSIFQSQSSAPSF